MEIQVVATQMLAAINSRGQEVCIYAELAEMPEFLHLMQKLVPSPEQLPDGTFRMTSAQEAKFAQGLMAISLREGYTERIAYE